MPGKELVSPQDGELSVDEVMLIRRKLLIYWSDRGLKGEKLDLKVRHELALRIEKMKRDENRLGF